MNRATTKFLAAATTICAFTAGALAAPAGAAAPTPKAATPKAATPKAAACKGAAVKPKIHADAVRREGTLASLVSDLQARTDPYGLDGAQIAVLQNANTGIAALDGQIAAACYPTLAALRADATKLFVDYRVYWLRVPQTHVIEAADRLADARARLGAAQAKLAPLVGANAQAQADLAAMNTALANADAQLGTPPGAGAAIAAVAPLQPAADMASDTAVLESAHAALLSVRSALVEARADGRKVVTDLHG